MCIRDSVKSLRPSTSFLTLECETFFSLPGASWVLTMPRSTSIDPAIRPCARGPKPFLLWYTFQPVIIDLRSDTVTRPSPAMREAMANAEVGDDVYGEDPTVLAFEAEVAARLGKEAALFVSSGTMGNQLAIAALTRPGDEVIVGEGAHVVFYESGAGPALSGVQFAIAGQGGLFDADDVRALVHPKEAYYCPRSSLVCLSLIHISEPTRPY